jgi:hypothetical protein
MDSKFISTMVISSILEFALFRSLTAEVVNVYAQQITRVSSSNENNPNQEEKDDNTKQEKITMMRTKTTTRNSMI